MPQSNWKNYLVKIIVPGSNGGDYIATGYPFKKNHLLTAWHAINKLDIDRNREWRFIWVHDKDSNSHAKYLKVENPVIFTSDSDLDWAVIQIDFDSNSHNPVCFCPHPPGAHSLVVSEGFPATRHKNPGGIEHIGYQGHAHSKADLQNYFQVDTVAGYKNPKDAGGMSGSPVFNSNGQLTGLFAMIPEGLDGSSVWVLSTESILKDKNFNCLLTPEQKSPRYTAIKTVLESRPCNQPQMLEFLYKAFDIDDQTIESLTAKIDSQSTQACLTAIHRYVRDSLSNHTVTLDSIIEFCNHLLPKLVTPSDQHMIDQSLERQSDQVWFEHSASTFEEVESHMAHYDGRPASYQPAGSEQEIEELRGMNAITFPEAAGGEINLKTKLIETESGFYTTFADPYTRRLQFPRLLLDQQQKIEAVKALQKSAADRLKFESEDRRQTRYYVSDNDKNDQHLELLAAKCPYFLLLKLSDDQDTISQEVNRYRPLQALYKKPKQN
ncbi:MAG: serine protease [Gammaproteobacteria bacterium]|nr:serine protease [Gammaproteobacteria bacterium]